MNTPHLRTTLAILTLLCLPAAATFAPAGFLSPTRSGPPRAGTPRLSQLAAPPAGPYTCIPVSVPPSRPATQAPSPAVTPAPYGQLPLQFESNQGQTDSHVRFLSRGRGYTLFLTGNEAVLSLRNAECRMQNAECRPLLGGAPVAERPANRKSKIENPKSAVVRMQLLGGNSGAPIQGLTPLPGKVNYLTGRGPRKWRTNIRTYAKVRCRGVYPGIDLVYYGQQQQLEYDFVVAPAPIRGASAWRSPARTILASTQAATWWCAWPAATCASASPTSTRSPAAGAPKWPAPGRWGTKGSGIRTQEHVTRNTQHAPCRQARIENRKPKIENPLPSGWRATTAPARW